MNELPPEILLDVMRRLDSPRQLARCAQVCHMWNRIASDGSLWVPFCLRYWVPPGPSVSPGERENVKDRENERFAVWTAGQDVAGQRDSKTAFVAWFRQFGQGGFVELYPRMKRLVCRMHAWLKANSPMTFASLQTGRFSWNDLCNELAARLPLRHQHYQQCDDIKALALLYHFIDGQKARIPQIDFGLFGAYSCYGQYTSLFLVPSVYLKVLTMRGIDFLVFALCPRTGKFLGIVVSPHLPQFEGHVMELNDEIGSYVDRGPFLDFFSNYVESLTNHQHDLIGPDRTICMFPLTGPHTSLEVTRGIKIEAASLLSLESGSPLGLWSYRIKMTYVGGPGAPGQCQLIRRHWMTRYQSGHVEHVHGNAVVGQHPILSDSSRSFAYCSANVGREVDGRMDFPVSMEGELTFVIGLMANATDQSEYFDVHVAPFHFEQAQFIPLQ